MGLDPDFDEARCAIAADAIRRGARFIATNADARYPTPDGFRPGAGSMVAAIGDAAGAAPLVIGKPEPAMFAAILTAAGVAPTEAIVIGDNPESDIAGAHRSGMTSILVLTGVTDAARAVALTGEQRPDFVAADPAEAWKLIAEWVDAAGATRLRSVRRPEDSSFPSRRARLGPPPLDEPRAPWAS